MEDATYEEDQALEGVADATKYLGATSQSVVSQLNLMVDERKIKEQAALLHKMQFLRGANQWDMRLDPDYQEFYRQKLKEEEMDAAKDQRGQHDQIDVST